MSQVSKHYNSENCEVCHFGQREEMKPQRHKRGKLTTVLMMMALVLLARR
jgi:hypothetical protein